MSIALLILGIIFYCIIYFYAQDSTGILVDNNLNGINNTRVHGNNNKINMEQNLIYKYLLVHKYH